MEKYKYNESNGLWYELQGDYYLPCLQLPKEEHQHNGIWGQQHLQYIKQYHKVLYLNLLTSGKLNGYLADVNKQAEEMFSQLVKEYADRQDITEWLKAENPLEWIGQMNNIRACAREVVEKEIVYC